MRTMFTITMMILAPGLVYAQRGGGGGRPPPGGGGGGGGAPENDDNSGGTGLRAVSLLGTIGRTTVSGQDPYDNTNFYVNEDIYGPFEAGFSSRQANILMEIGCSSEDANSINIPGGIDTAMTEKAIAYICDIELPRIENDQYYGLVDSCGGHTQEYHFHERLDCLYDTSSGGHSPQIGYVLDGGQPIYGKWEDYSANLLPNLDACGGHWGATPDSPDDQIYHYQVQENAPFTVGCIGPDDDGNSVTQAQCESLYPGCSADSYEIMTRDGAVDYKLWCPCYGASSPTGSPISSPTAPTDEPTLRPTSKPTTKSPTTPTTSPVASPTSEGCEDSSTWYKKKTWQTCDWISEKPTHRCTASDGVDGTSAHESCQATCGCIPDGCENSATWMFKKASRSCDWVARKADRRCSLSGADGTLASASCPISCDTC